MDNVKVKVIETKVIETVHEIPLSIGMKFKDTTTDSIFMLCRGGLELYDLICIETPVNSFNKRVGNRYFDMRSLEELRKSIQEEIDKKELVPLVELKENIPEEKEEEKTKRQEEEEHKNKLLEALRLLYNEYDKNSCICSGVKCENCPFYNFAICPNADLDD